MKALRHLTVLLGVLALAAGLCAMDFEGKIRFKMTSPDKPARSSSGDGSTYMSYCLKGGLMRVDMESGNGQVFSSIIDPVKREVTILMPPQKRYMTRTMPEPKPAAGTATPPKDVEFVRTGETETILGYKCEKVLVRSKEGEAEIWGAEGLGIFYGMGNRNPMGRTAPRSAWETALAEHGFFPLRMVSRDKSGQEQMRMEAVSIDPQPLPDSAFVPPADYRKFEMPAIPGLGGFGRGSD